MNSNLKPKMTLQSSLCTASKPPFASLDEFVLHKKRIHSIREMPSMRYFCDSPGCNVSVPHEGQLRIHKLTMHFNHSNSALSHQTVRSVSNCVTSFQFI